MKVKENLICFQILWKGEPDRIADTKKTIEAIKDWISNETMEISLELCGASKNGPIDLVFENHYSSSDVEMRLLTMQLRELIAVFRSNANIVKVWLKWDDITDDIIWTDGEAQIEMNRLEHQKGDNILIHQKYKL